MQKNDTQFRKIGRFFWLNVNDCMRPNNEIKEKGRITKRNEPNYYKYTNLEPIAVKSRCRLDVAAASRSPAEE
jgi:hypothetical protein